MKIIDMNSAEMIQNLTSAMESIKSEYAESDALLAEIIDVMDERNASLSALQAEMRGRIKTVQEAITKIRSLELEMHLLALNAISGSRK